MKLSPLFLLLTVLFLLLLTGGTAGWFAHTEEAKSSSAVKTTGTLVSVGKAEVKDLPFLEPYTQFVPSYEYTVGEEKHYEEGPAVKTNKNPFPKKVVERDIYYNADNPSELVDPKSQTPDFLYMVAGGTGLLVALLSALGLVKGNRKILRFRV